MKRIPECYELHNAWRNPANEGSEITNFEAPVPSCLYEVRCALDHPLVRYCLGQQSTMFILIVRYIKISFAFIVP